MNWHNTIIGMIHLQALPNTPSYQNNDQYIIDKALEEALLYKEAGIDMLMIENMHDVPYLKYDVGHEVSSLMTVIAYEIKRQTKLPCGIQILAGANKAALAVAKAAQLDFIRAEGFVFAHIADEGYIESCAGDLLRYRRQINAEHIKIFTDIKKKHSAHSITADINIVETAKTAAYFKSDGLIITGTATGESTSIEELKAVKQACHDIPILVGSGITLDNVTDYITVADGFIVGSWFKENAYWANNINKATVEAFVDKVKQYGKT